MLVTPGSASRDAVCAGESMVMLVPEPPGPPSPDMVFRPTVAGAESNAACYLASFGVGASWLSRLGDDPFGRFIADDLSSRGVDVSNVEVDPERATGIAFKDRSVPETRVRYFRRGSAASALSVDDAERVRELGPGLVHLSGITSALSPSCREFVSSLVEKPPSGALLSYDVNWRPALWAGLDREVIVRNARGCDVVLVGLDEAQALWGRFTPEQVRDLLPQPSLLVVKQGAKGATVFDGTARHVVPSFRVDVVEPVGAGDAFAGGFLAGLHRGYPPVQAARLGVVAASSALVTTGDVGELLPGEVIDELLALDADSWNRQRYPVPGHEGSPDVTDG